MLLFKLLTLVLIHEKLIVVCLIFVFNSVRLGCINSASLVSTREVEFKRLAPIQLVFLVRKWAHVFIFLLVLIKVLLLLLRVERNFLVIS